MNSTDLKKLSNQFMINAVKTKPGDNIWIEYVGPKAKALAEACAKKVKAAGANPFIVDSSSAVINQNIAPLSGEELEAFGKQKLEQMKKMQGYIRIKDDADQAKISLSPEQMAAYNKAMRQMTDHRVNNTNWLVIATPTEEFAKECGMGFDEFKTFYRNVCLLDYDMMGEAVKPLVKLMAEGKTVRIYSPNQETDISFSIAGINAKPCTGARNIPDGECYTAPVKNSVNGIIKFGPSVYNGQKFSSLKLTFADGKIIDAQAENAERTIALNKILDTDEGARYTGEFAINFNPYIQHPTGSILFDEKIDGGIHIAMGSCYDEASNGNKSAIHWDMVHIQRSDYGGGELYIDDRIIRKDGIFVIPELLGLNPDNLKSASKPSPKATKPKN